MDEKNEAHTGGITCPDLTLVGGRAGIQALESLVQSLCCSSDLRRDGINVTHCPLLKQQKEFQRLSCPLLVHCVGGQEGTLFDLKSHFFFCLFAISWATPAAYGGSQARGLIGAIATSLHQGHSNVGSRPHLQPTPQLMATPDP